MITEHSTIGLVVTTDGSVTDLPREEYEECERRVIGELKEIGKPFVVLLNSTEPDSARVQQLVRQMSEEYSTAVMAVNCLELNEEKIREILGQALYAFPVREINISMPSWINTLEKGHWLKSSVFESIRKAAAGVEDLKAASELAKALEGCEYISSSRTISVDPGVGSADIGISLEPELFYRVIGEATGLQISSENELMPKILELVKIKSRFEKYADAIEEMESTGYGIVMPEQNELSLEQPEIIRQGGKYGVRLKAQASAVHLVKTTINTEVEPIVGSQKQSEELVDVMMSDLESRPEKIWESNIFGKSLHELVGEGLNTKLAKLPTEARMRLRETIERMINEGCSGLICLIL